MSELEERVETEASVTEAEADNMEAASPIVEQAAPAVEDTAPVTGEAAPVTEEAAPVIEEAHAAEAEAPDAAEAAPETASRPVEKSWYESAGDRSEEKPPVYADAHFEPAGSTTVPPRYYTPPVRQEKEKRAKPAEKRHLGLRGAVALSLVCALLGGCLGAGISTLSANKRFEALETALEENSQADAETAAALATAEQRQNSLASPVASAAGLMSPSQIYQLACSQVVGITTKVTTQSFFGTQTGTVSGSGFILSEDGYILTNYHVVENADAGNLPITVVLYDGSSYEARIVGKEDVNDLAVLKIEASGLQPAVLGNSDEMQVGDEIYVVGNPLGELEFSMSTGHVSALNRSITTEGAIDIPMFQLDAAVNHGNSGGPVYNTRGEVVGIVTAKNSGSDVEGLGFAIPSSDAARIAEDLVTKGYVTGKAYLGIWTDERYNAMVAQYYNMPLGAYVADVSQGSAADKAGLTAGDIITALDDVTIESPSELRSAIRGYNAGDSAELTYYHAGESKTVTIVFDERTPEADSTAPATEP